MIKFICFSGSGLEPESIVISSEVISSDSGSVSSGSSEVVFSEVESIVSIPDENRTLWNTEFSDYSVVEGLLLLVFILVFVVGLFRLFGSGRG